MRVGILGKDIEGWGTQQLKASLEKRGAASAFFNFESLVAKVGYRPAVNAGTIDLVEDLSALLVRPVGRGSLEEIIFRMDLLHRLERLGILVVNPARTIERCADKFYALALLEEKGIPVPRTMVTENLTAAMKGFHELDRDIILKPIFGSRGIGSTRISDANVAERVFSTILFHHGVLYIQEYVPHGNSDIRAFVVGRKVVAAMRRIGQSWKTNVSQGAKPEAFQLNEENEALAVKAAETVDCRIAGVDILEGQNGSLVIELNSQPGWSGLQSVSNVNIADCIVDYVLGEVGK